MRADLKETDTAFIVEAELPGFKKEDISLEYKNSTLMKAAKKEEETKKRRKTISSGKDIMARHHTSLWWKA